VLIRSFNLMLAAVERSRGEQTRLVADAGHELRTPLTSMRTNVDLLTQAEAVGGLAEADRLDMLQDISDQVDELSSLVSDLVELARNETEPRREASIDLAEILNNAVERVRRRAPGMNFDIRTRPWTVVGDPRELERAAVNLLDNAVKWSPPGGLITVRLSNGTISVLDQGPGIPDEDLPYVFDRFFRSEESRTMPGSGLGLAIVRHAANRHGGKVSAGHGPHGGALMTITIPHSSSRAIG
jgi:two-component system sensor histidine kinase MprB